MVTEVHMPAEDAVWVAQRLLAAAEKLGLPPGVVETSSSGLYGLSFHVPQAVFDQMVKDSTVDDGPEDDAPEPEKPKRKPGRPKRATAAKEVTTDGE
jgi:hypothetical protein